MLMMQQLTKMCVREGDKDSQIEMETERERESSCKKRCVCIVLILREGENICGISYLREREREIDIPSLQNASEGSFLL